MQDTNGTSWGKVTTSQFKTLSVKSIHVNNEIRTFTLPNRIISAFRSARIGGISNKDTGPREIRAELDSHADTCVVGDSCALVIQDFMRPVRVHGYDDEIGEDGLCKTVAAVVAYDDSDGETYMIVINQAILVNRMKNNLISVFQARDNGVRINEDRR